MPNKAPVSSHILPKEAYSLPLRWVLVVPFVLQIFAAVSLTGYLSFRNGQKAIDDLATQLQAEVSDRIDQHLDSYLSLPVEIAQINVDAIQLGLLDPQNFELTGQYFWRQLQVFDKIAYISYALPTGEYSGAGHYLEDGSVTIDEKSADLQWKQNTYATDSHGNRTKIIDTFDYKPLLETWYTETVQVGKPIWNQVYAWDGLPNILSVSVSYPLYNEAGALRCVMSVDLLLSSISDFLRTLEVSPSTKTFIVERSGLAIATSSNEPPYTFSAAAAESKRLNVLNSTDPTIRATAQYLESKFGALSNIEQPQQLSFQFNGDRQFVQVTPWQDELGLDWLVVVTVPASDFMGQIHKNNRITVLLCLLALAIATWLGIRTSHWIAQPMLRLAQASEAIASGDLSQTLQPSGTREMRTLGHSFNQMAQQLRESFRALEKTNEVLEQRVEARTAELKTAKEAADSASQAKSDFLANMSHELRTPLNGILGYAQILHRDSATNPQQKDKLSIIQQCGNHLLTLINDILDISKIEARKLELCPHEFDLAKLVVGVKEIFQLKAQQKKIVLDCQMINLPSGISADEKRLRQVLINLIGNAIKFTDQGRITLTVSALEGDPALQHIRFQVTDTGVGMTPKQLEKIFLPFEQVGDTSRMAEGTGLGLAISGKIIESMGGQLQVESTSGSGSRFWFDLLLPVATQWHPESLSHDLTHNLTETIVSDQSEAETDTIAFVLPPIKMLIPIYEAAMAGYILEIKAAAQQLKQQPEYGPFADKILALAEDLDDAAIADLIEPYLA
jgi:signal transduction histidine kinase